MPSISEIARSIQAVAREVADRVIHPNRAYRYTREQAATIISEATGVPYSTETLRKSGCPYISVAGHVLYADYDLIALATDILARAQKRGSTTQLRLDARRMRPLEGLAAAPNSKAGKQHAGLSAVAGAPIATSCPKKVERNVSGHRLTTAELTPADEEPGSEAAS